MGVEKTHWLIARKFYWPKLRADINQYIASCDVCQRTKVARHKPYGELSPLPQPSRPFEQVTLDFIVKLPPTKWKGLVVNSILVVMDRYAKFGVYLPCNETITASELADAFVDAIVTRFGAPRGVVSDRGPQMASGYWRDFCIALGAKRKLSTAYHPQTDGQTERQNQNVEQYIRCFASTRQSDWASLLPMAEYVYNSSKHSTTGVSPMMALYGYQPDITPGVEDVADKGKVQSVLERIEKLNDDRETLRLHWQFASESQTRFYNANHILKHFIQGDLVLLSTKNLTLALPKRKFSPHIVGPFAVQEVIGS